MRVLLLGASGQLGALVAARAPSHVKLSAYGSPVCDISDAANVRNVIHKTGPDLIINCAAYTQVDKAESEPDIAYAVNREGVANLVHCSPEATRILHVSTDFVFDGKATEPYKPDAPTAPLGVYGASKLAGEQVLTEQAARRSCIVRTAWLYAAEGGNFMNTMLRLMRTRDSLSVVNDQVGTPTAAHRLSEVLWRFAERPDLTGIWHWTDGGQATWYDFAVEIQRQALALGLLKQAIPIQPIPTSDYPTPARRPAYSVLDKTLTLQALELANVPWQQALSEVLEQLSALPAT